jgi:hypothetical protein
MIPLTGTSRSPRRIFPCVHMEYFVPLAEMKLQCSSIMHLSMLTPREGGSGKGWGFDIFTKKKCQMPLHREKIPGQNSPPPG